MQPLTIKQAEPTALQGLNDGGHIYVKCSNCRAYLMDVWRTRPHETDVWKIKANCPFCGDESFIEEIQGGFHFGGYGKLADENTDEDHNPASTIVENFDVVDDTFQFNLLKAVNGKPIYSAG